MQMKAGIYCGMIPCGNGNYVAGQNAVVFG